MSNPQRSDATVGADAALTTLAAEYGLTCLSSVPEDALDPALVSELPVEWARKHVLLPIRLDGRVCALTCDPAAVTEQEYLALLLGVTLQPVLATRETVMDCIQRCYYRRTHTPDDFVRALDSTDNAVPEAALQSEDLLSGAGGTPVTQLVNLILLEALKQKASDIHFEPFESRLRVRYRIDGVLYEQSSPPKHMEDALVSRLKVMAHMDIAERRLPQDGMARVRVGDREIDVRLSTIPVAEGERVVLRLLEGRDALLPLSALGMSGACLAAFESALATSNGIIVVSGPTGSGKTTTLYAALNQLDGERHNILTIEDPIEYRLANIGQMQVKPKIGLTFSVGLRHLLRQDPDVILIGETRDRETAEIATRASLTGHVVLTTLHTNDAAAAVTRLIDMGIEPHLLSSCLRAVLAQRLVRRLCPQCRRAVTVADIPGVPQVVLDAHGADPAWEPGGCEACLEGYRGRTGIFEMLTVDRSLQSAIRGGCTAEDALRNAAVARGMVSLQDHGFERALAGETSFSEVLASTWVGG